MSSGNRVGEIFSAAGVAFAKLGELTTHLHSTVQEPNPVGQKWDEEDIEHLKAAVRRFGEDLGKLSETIKSKSTSQLKTGLKRKLYEESGVPLNSPQAAATPAKKAAGNSLVKTPAGANSTSKVITKPAHNNSTAAFNNSISESENDSIDT